MTETAAPMHSEAQPRDPLLCEVCRSPFTPRRGAWARARFCSTKCRNTFHAAEARLEALREAGPRLYAALRRISDGKTDGLAPDVIADAAIKDLKPPIEPKALLEKAKA